MTPLVNSGFFDDTLPEEDLPLNPPSPLPAPRPSPNALIQVWRPLQEQRLG